MPTIIQQWKKSLTRAELTQANKVQNFAKHSYTDSDQDARTVVVTEYGELLIVDSIMCNSKMPPQAGATRRLSRPDEPGVAARIFSMYPLILAGKV